MSVAVPTFRKRLGPYEILQLLGAGGMGEVYRARDTRLRREVAIKVLPATASADQELVQRLGREARAVSQLNHPNIVAIYDIGSEDGVEYVVMELLDGETLGARLRHGPLPPRKALEYAVQIARGLAAAHEKHIVHRDLKPENVFLTRDGRVKILDFGLAHRTSTVSHHTAAVRLTEPGMVVGTTLYMSPEQARGLDVDHRSDIFSFGVLLYEIVSGINPFEAESNVETMMNIIHKEPPDLATLVPALPPILHRVIHHCLEKTPEARFQSAFDLIFDLENCSEIAVTAVAKARPEKKRPVWWWVAGAVLGLLAIVAAAMFALRTGNATSGVTPSFQRLTFRRGIIQSARFTADGGTVVYSASWDGEPLRLHLLRTDRPESQVLPLPNATLNAISPSGEMAIILNGKIFDWSEGGTLAQVPVLGGTPRELLDSVVTADWSRDGRMAVVRHNDKGVQIEYPAGHVLFSSDHQLVLALRLSPKGDQLAAHVMDIGALNGEIALIGLDGSKRTLVKGVISGPGMAWTPDGKEIWYSATPQGDTSTAPAIFAVTTGGAQHLVIRMPGWLWIQDISRDGTALMSYNTWQSGIILPGDARHGGEYDLAWLDWSILADISSDGKSVLFTEAREGVSNRPTVYVRGTDDSAAVRLENGLALGFSPDNRSVLALTDTLPRRVLILPMRAGKMERLRNDLDCLWAGWLPDGRILISARTPQGPRMFVQARDSGAPQPLTPPGMSIGATDPEGGGGVKPISPDGRWVLVFDAQGRAWLQPIAGGPARPLSGILPDDRPAGWSADSERIFVYQPTVPIRMHEVPIATGERKFLQEIGFSDLAGIYKVGPILLMPDGHSFAKGYKRTMSTLYAAEGLR